jgi:hypothetical protein
MNSLSIYGDSRNELPVSVELTNKSCKIRLSQDLTRSDSIHIPSHWKYVMICVRNYLVPPGTTVLTPEIVSIQTNQILRHSEKLNTGATNLHVNYSKQWRKYQYFLVGHVCVWIVNIVLYVAIMRVIERDLPCSIINITHTLIHMVTSLFTTTSTSTTEGTSSGSMRRSSTIEIIYFQFLIIFFINLLISFFSILLFYFIYQLIFFIGKIRLYSFCYQNVNKNKYNEIKLCQLEIGVKGSQPSKLHTYYLMSYHLQLHEELSICGKIDTKRQAYWSFVIYDEYGIPLPAYVYDDNVIRKYPSSVGKRDLDLYEYDIRMINYSDQSDQRETLREEGITTVDVSKNSKGYVLFRLVHPKDDEVCQYSHPEVKLIKYEHKKQQ